MNFIIIGATSFIGSKLYLHCKENEFSVIGTSNRELKNSELYQFELGKDKIDKVLNLDYLGKNGACAIICAAITDMDWCYLHKEESNRINVIETIELIKTLRFYGISCVFLSSEAVFDGKQGYYSEADRVNPITVYGRQKVEVEDFLIKNNPNDIVLRISRAISGEKCTNDLLYSFWQKAIKKESILCIKDQSFTPTDVMDIVTSILKCIEEKLKGLYHISNNELFTRAELAIQFCEYFDLACEVKELQSKEIGCKDNRHIYGGLNAQKFVEKTGISFIRVEDIIKKFKA